MTASRLAAGGLVRGHVAGAGISPNIAARITRAWRAAHPEYRERERIRRRLARGLDPATPYRPVPALLPIAVGPCSVCGREMTYVCDFCRKGLR